MRCNAMQCEARQGKEGSWVTRGYGRRDASLREGRSVERARQCNSAVTVFGAMTFTDINRRLALIALKIAIALDGK